MATIIEEIVVAEPVDQVWARLADVGAIHTQLAPGFVVDTRMEAPDVRVVTFADGFVAQERILSVDSGRRRLAYTIFGGALAHHNASFQLHAEDERRTRVVWTADLSPDDLQDLIRGMMQTGLKTMAAAIAG
jgi:carbon monoxide dehydrogenase subunit G